ncbi:MULTISPECIES: PRTRC system protein B [Methylomonas]|uniref:PRTRC system protein B n=1 Tax=Methylomonas koyamae TaxID=702114 RepID=A0A177P4D8_9GAMM|nr:PRTRC system protein B [Methylomonas koyamae]OAI25177.1 hypothetical protein A1355_19920 [Methylomonas koyamae]
MPYVNFFQQQPPDFQPLHAILVHQARKASGYAGAAVLASLHDLTYNDNQACVVGAGRLLDKADIEQVLRSMADLTPTSVELLPKSVVSISDRHIAWTVAAGVRPMLFKPAGSPLVNLMVPWPGLLLVANRHQRLAVAAFGTRGRVHEKTKLYAAPLMNVSSQGAVCSGSATLPNGCDIGDLPAWEAVMFSTAFTHIGNPNTLLIGSAINPVDNQAHLAFWRNLANRNAAAFPKASLVEAGIGVKQFIQQHA